MPDEVVESPEEEAPEAQEQPTPEVPSVPSAGAEPSAPSGFDVEAFVEALEDPRVAQAFGKAIREPVRRQVQSFGDSGLAQVRRIAEYLERHKGDVEAAEREMKMDAILEGQTSSAPPGGTGEAGDTEETVAMQAISTELLSGAGIPFDHPEYRALVSQYGGQIRNPQHWETIVSAFVRRLTAKAEKQETSVTAASAVGESGVPTASPADVDSATAELDAIQRGSMGSLTNPTVAKRREELREYLAANTEQRPDIQ